ncbi:MAG TPA: trypsin-like serine protease [Polyangiaceae bacterium]|nr:trypsin-like serine protease [Polyangiaceae bacterium]
MAETSIGVAAAMGIGVLLGACGGLPDDVLERVTTAEQAIAGGYLDPEDRAVVGVQSPGHPICSGALIARNVVLTARHCVSDVYGTPMSNHDFCEVSTCGPPRPAEEFYVTNAESFPLDPGAYHRVREVVGLESSYLCGSDLALLILEEPLDEEEASPLVPRVDEPLQGGDEYSAIGYGGTDGAGAGAGIRRRRDGLVATCVGAACPLPEPPTYIEIKDTEWMGFEGTCPGDSGGPAIDREGRVAGISSRGEAACKTSIYSHVAGWGAWIKQTTAHAASLGGFEAPAWTQTPPPPPKEPPVDPAHPAGVDEAAGSACSLARPANLEEPNAPRAITALSALALLASWRKKPRRERRSGRAHEA